MRSGRAIAALAFLLALLTGCGPKQPKTSVSQAAQAPSLPPSQMAALVSPVPPPIPAPKMPVVKLDATTPPEAKTETAKSEPHHSTKHHPKPVVPLDTPQEAPKTTAQNGTPAQVPNAQPTEMSPLGQLSTANDNANTADRRYLSDQIDATENGLNAIKRSFTPDEQKTVALIRTYITRARDALKADDLDGSRTLSTKAKQLLEELTKP
jgi:outer membrane biosynthesis protein TonB